MSLLRDVPLNVLDLAPKAAGATNAEAVAGAVALAQRAEALGYGRFWVAEHHGMPAVASSSPPVLIGGIAAATSSIRVGSGGVMLPNHAPLVVAEQFGTLRALYGDRIDLGLGRAPGTDGATAAALRRSEAGIAEDEFPRQLLDLIGFFHGGLPESNPASRITAVPGFGDAPEFWLLGSSGYSAQVAAALGIRFAFAHHFAGDNTEAALDLYRQKFRPSDFLEKPHSMIAVNVIADASAEVARAESLPSTLGFLAMRQGQKPQPVSIDEALAHEWQPWELDFMNQRNARQAVGTPDHVERQLSSLLASTDVDELMIISQAATLAGRVRSIEIVAELAGLAGRAPAQG